MLDGHQKFEVVCPCCHSTLTVDAKTGLVLHTGEKKTAYSFDEAVEHVKKRKDMADELFQKAFNDEKKRRDSLEDKFQQALDSKDELDEPSRPWDLD